MHDQCSCNFTSTDLEDPQLTCSDDGSMAVFTTTVLYSNNNGDITTSDIINVLKSWAAINGADASIGIGGDTATISQVCSPTCESLRLSFGNNSGAVAAGTFIGGLLGGIILVAIPVVFVW